MLIDKLQKWKVITNEKTVTLKIVCAIILMIELKLKIIFKIC